MDKNIFEKISQKFFFCLKKINQSWFKTPLYIFVLVFVGFFLRGWNLGNNLHFAYDQGRDALVIQGLIEYGKPFLIGPTTGIQGVFLGPFFYYLILPFYFLGRGNPAIPALFLAFFSSLSIWFIYLLGKELFNEKAGKIAAFLLCFSSYAINFSRQLSNITPLIPMSLLIFLFLFKSFKGETKYFPLVGLLVGLSLQTELANAFFIALVVAIYSFIFVFKKITIKQIILTAVLFLITFFPQIVFDFRHEHLISRAVINNFVNDANKTSLEAVWKTRPAFIFRWLVDSLGVKLRFAKSQTILFFDLVFLVIVVLGSIFMMQKRKEEKKGLLLVFLWLFIPGISYLFYKGNYGLFFDYYLVSLFLPFFLMISYLLAKFFQGSKNSQIFAAFFLGIFFSANLGRQIVFLKPSEWGYSLFQLNQTVDYVLGALNPGEEIWVRPPNNQPTAYEYLFNLKTKKLGLPEVKFNQNSDEFFVIYEPDSFKERFEGWYLSLVKDKLLLEQREFGIIITERYSSK